MPTNLFDVLAGMQAPTQGDPNLRKKYPFMYGLLGGLAGTAPDQFEGSVLDPKSAQVRAGAEYGFPVGIAAQVLPLAKPTQAAAMAAGRAGEQFAERVVPNVMARGGLPAEMLNALSQGSRSHIFIGPKSKIWDSNAAEEAVKMLSAGIDPAKVWLDTGTGRAFGGLRQEISDYGAGVIKDAFEKVPKRNEYESSFFSPIKESYQHQKFFESYPEAEKIETRLMYGKGVPKDERGGSYIFTSSSNVAPRITAYEGSLKGTNSLSNPGLNQTIIHELQHYVQGQEMFPRGGSPNMFDPNAELGFLTKYYGNPLNAYKYLSGEAEARLAAARSTLNPKYLRKNYPFEFKNNPYKIDVDPDKLIYLKNNGLFDYIGY